MLLRTSDLLLVLPHQYLYVFVFCCFPPLLFFWPHLAHPGGNRTVLVYSYFYFLHSHYLCSVHLLSTSTFPAYTCFKLSPSPFPHPSFENYCKSPVLHVFFFFFVSSISCSSALPPPSCYCQSRSLLVTLSLPSHTSQLIQPAVLSSTHQSVLYTFSLHQYLSLTLEAYQCLIYLFHGNSC